MNLNVTPFHMHRRWPENHSWVLLARAGEQANQCKHPDPHTHKITRCGATVAKQHLSPTVYANSTPLTAHSVPSIRPLPDHALRLPELQTSTCSVPRPIPATPEAHSCSQYDVSSSRLMMPELAHRATLFHQMQQLSRFRSHSVGDPVIRHRYKDPLRKAMGVRKGNAPDVRNRNLESITDIMEMAAHCLLKTSYQSRLLPTVIALGYKRAYRVNSSRGGPVVGDPDQMVGISPERKARSSSENSHHGELGRAIALIYFYPGRTEPREFEGTPEGDFMTPSTLKPGQPLMLLCAQRNAESLERLAYFVRREPALGKGGRAKRSLRFPEYASQDGPEDDGTCQISDYKLVDRARCLEDLCHVN